MSTQPDSGLAVRGLAHDLSNLLQIVLSAADSISADHRHSAAASIIARSVRQAMDLLDEEAQQRQDVDLKPALERAGRLAADFAKMIGPPDLSVGIQVDPGFRVYARPASLDRVFMNLLLNAVEAAAAAGRESLSIVAVAWRDNQRIGISISDDGPGFSPGVLSGETPSQSSGLGLRIVRDAVLREGGAVSAANGPSGGATFTLDFEAAPALPRHPAFANAAS